VRHVEKIEQAGNEPLVVDLLRALAICQRSMNAGIAIQFFCKS